MSPAVWFCYVNGWLALIALAGSLWKRQVSDAIVTAIVAATSFACAYHG